MQHERQYIVTLTDHHPKLGGDTVAFRFGTRNEVREWAEREVQDAEAMMLGTRVTFKIASA